MFLILIVFNRSQYKVFIKICKFLKIILGLDSYSNQNFKVKILFFDFRTYLLVKLIIRKIMRVLLFYSGKKSQFHSMPIQWILYFFLNKVLFIYFNMFLYAFRTNTTLNKIQMITNFCPIFIRKVH